MSPNAKLIYTTRMPVRWGDMDAYGHVNNTVYFRYMEQTRIEWLETFDYGVTHAQDEAAVIVNASCTFLVPIAYPAIVEIRMYVGKPGRTSLPTYYEIRCEGEDVLYAEGAAKLVWFLPASGKSAPLPERIRASAERH